MTLLTIVAALLVSRFMQWPARLREYQWYAAYLQWLQSRLTLRGVPGLLLVLALPLSVVIVLQALLDEGAGLALGLVFAWLVLLGSLGRHDLLAQLAALVHGDAGNAQQAATLARELGDEDAETLAGDALTRLHEDYLGPVFWFLLLGPVGAVLYRAAVYLAAHEGAAAGVTPAADFLHGLLGWPSARLTALSFALMGHFDRSLHVLVQRAGWDADPAAANRALLRESAAAALDLGGETSVRAGAEQARRLALRTLGLWLALLALLTLAGWLG